MSHRHHTYVSELERIAADVEAIDRHNATTLRLIAAGLSESLSLEPLFTKLEVKIMDQLAQLSSDIADLKQAAADAAQRDATAQAGLQTIIDSLKTHPAAPDLAQQIADIEAVTKGLAAIASAPATPPADAPTP